VTITQIDEALLLGDSPVVGLRETGRHDRDGTRAMGDRVLDTGEHGFSRQAHHRQINGSADVCHVGDRRHPMDVDAPGTRIDAVEPPWIAAVHDVAKQQVSGPARCSRCSENSDGPRLEQWLQVEHARLSCHRKAVSKVAEREHPGPPQCGVRASDQRYLRSKMTIGSTVSRYPGTPMRAIRRPMCGGPIRCGQQQT
jgi:hypothetical protein